MCVCVCVCVHMLKFFFFRPGDYDSYDRPDSRAGFFVDASEDYGRAPRRPNINDEYGSGKSGSNEDFGRAPTRPKSSRGGSRYANGAD